MSQGFSSEEKVILMNIAKGLESFKQQMKLDMNVLKTDLTSMNTRLDTRLQRVEEGVENIKKKF